MHEARDKKKSQSASAEHGIVFNWNVSQLTLKLSGYLYTYAQHSGVLVLASGDTYTVHSKMKWEFIGRNQHAFGATFFATLLLPLSFSFVSSSSCWRISSLLLSLTIRATITNTDERTEIEKRKKFGQIYASLDGTKADCAISILSTNFAGSIFFAFVYISVNHAVSIGIRPRYFH